MITEDVFDKELPELEAEENGYEFHIDSDTAANWLLRRLANIDAEKARVQAQATAIIKQLESDADRLKRLYEGELQEFCRQKLQQTGSRRKSVTFLQGNTCFRQVPASLRVADQAAALAFAQSTGLDVVKVVKTLDAATYREHAQKWIQESGELLPGIERTPEHITFRIDFPKSKD